ncbi:nitronate monooxygenase [Marinobacter confluentis]|nr:nitronate monooxygenase [Marinobacter confluentis]
MKANTQLPVVAAGEVMDGGDISVMLEHGANGGDPDHCRH